MSKVTPEKTHALLEKLAEYVMTEVPTKREMEARFEGVHRRFEDVNKRFEGVNKRFEGVDRRFDQMDRHFDQLESDVHETKENVKKILNGMDSQVKELEILRTEQVAIKSGLARVERRVDVLEKVVDQ